MKNPLATRFSSESPALVAPEHGERVEADLHHAWDRFSASLERRNLEPYAGVESASDEFWSEDWSWVRPYIVSEGVLQIPVKGVLLSGFPYQAWDWATGYEYIQAAFARGMADPDVKGIAFIIDSPGGEVEGNFDLVDFMSGDAKKKPVQAFAVSAYSAAYSIASAADKITVTRTGGVGSIGVVTSHVDMSKALDDWGYKITFIFAGKHKVDGNPYQPLPDDVKSRIQASVDKLYGMFVAIVARNRGMDEQAVRDTEALTYLSDDALKIGLADDVGPLVDSLAAFAAEVNTEGAMLMSNADKSADTSAMDTARAEGTKAGASAERERIKAILESPEASNRADAARNIALNTDMTSEQAVSLLKTLPETKAEAPQKEEPQGSGGRADHFKAVMDGDKHPNIEAGGEGAHGSGGNGAEASDSSKILADYRAAGGVAIADKK